MKSLATPENDEMQEIWIDEEFLKASKSVRDYVRSVPRNKLFKISYALNQTVASEIAERVLMDDEILGIK